MSAMQGLEWVGQGVVLDNKGYDKVNKLYFDQSNMVTDENSGYDIPENYSLYSDAKNPTGVFDGQIDVYESYDEFIKQFKIQVEVVGKYAGFEASSEFELQTSQKRISSYYYCLLRYFVNKYKLEVGGEHEPLDIAGIPGNDASLDDYRDWFSKNGTHYIAGAWIGGDLSLTAVVSKNESVSDTSLRAAISAAYAGSSVDALTESQQKTISKLDTSSKTVSGRGGKSELRASCASFTSICDQDKVDAWLNSIDEELGTTELMFEPIWNLLDDAEIKNRLEQKYTMLYVDADIEFYEGNYNTRLDLPSLIFGWKGSADHKGDDWNHIESYVGNDMSLWNQHPNKNSPNRIGVTDFVLSDKNFQISRDYYSVILPFTDFVDVTGRIVLDGTIHASDYLGGNNTDGTQVVTVYQGATGKDDDKIEAIVSDSNGNEVYRLDAAGRERKSLVFIVPNRHTFTVSGGEVKAYLSSSWNTKISKIPSGSTKKNNKNLPMIMMGCANNNVTGDITKEGETLTVLGFSQGSDHPITSCATLAVPAGYEAKLDNVREVILVETDYDL